MANSGHTLEVLFTPAEFGTLAMRDLSHTLCVVFDVLRATSSIVSALANGASALRPVSDIAEALELRERDPELLLAGERDGLRIHSRLTGGIEFDFGNSPREFTAEHVRGRRIAITTTNGTRALRACAQAEAAWLGCFLNLQATADRLSQRQPDHLLLVCSGTIDQCAYEDVLGAGALCDLIWSWCTNGRVADSALMARRLFLLERENVTGAVGSSRNGQRLLSRPELAADVTYCSRRDVFALTAELGTDGWVRAGV